MLHLHYDDQYSDQCDNDFVFIFYNPMGYGKFGSGLLELPWALAWYGTVLVQVSQFGEDQLLLPWADCTGSTSELICEDSRVIISLDAS